MARPPHKPTNETIATVEALSSCGINQDMIASYMGMAKKTLIKHYGDYMSICHTNRLKQVANMAFKLALEGHPGMIMFILKTQGEWREADKRDTDKEKDSEQVTKIQIETVNGETIKKEES